MKRIVSFETDSRKYCVEVVMAVSEACLNRKSKIKSFLKVILHFWN